VRLLLEAPVPRDLEDLLTASGLDREVLSDEY
jgi:hypothetical protein